MAFDPWLRRQTHWHGLFTVGQHTLNLVIVAVLKNNPTLCLLFRPEHLQHCQCIIKEKGCRDSQAKKVLHCSILRRLTLDADKIRSKKCMHCQRFIGIVSSNRPKTFATCLLPPLTLLNRHRRMLVMRRRGRKHCLFTNGQHPSKSHIVCP